MVVRFIMPCLILVYAIQSSNALECYSCTGKQECGILFSPESSHVKIVHSRRKESFSSCSISVTPEGLTTRDVVPSHICRSSSNQFCCNEDLCNHLASPPLPALTSLKCAVSKCTMSNGLCINDAAHVTVLSSATESCSITFDTETHKFYKNGCRPTVNDVASLRHKHVHEPSVLCCNSPECNQDILHSANKGPAIQCYTCDSRITGLAGCMTLNTTSPHVYKAGSSSHLESCATIFGMEGRDTVTGAEYPAFAIRTFISKCISQPLGTVYYGGAAFQGRIDCCSDDFCNTQNLDTASRLPLKNRRIGRNTRKIILFGIGIVFLFLIVAGIAIAIWFCYRSRQKRGKGKYDQCATTELSNLPKSSIHTIENKFTRPVSTAAYPEASADPRL